MTLKGKTLFISGGSRGIGLAIALRAARDGANVAIAAHGMPALKSSFYKLDRSADIFNWDAI